MNLVVAYKHHGIDKEYICVVNDAEEDFVENLFSGKHILFCEVVSMYVLPHNILYI